MQAVITQKNIVFVEKRQENLLCTLAFFVKVCYNKYRGKGRRVTNGKKGYLHEALEMEKRTVRGFRARANNARASLWASYAFFR